MSKGNSEEVHGLALNAEKTSFEGSEKMEMS